MSDGQQGDSISEELHWIVERDMEKCSLCEVCTKSCKTGALEARIDGNVITIFFRAELCDGCGLCVQRCPEEASILTRIDGPIYATSARILSTSNLLQCLGCGAFFAPIRKLENILRHHPGMELVTSLCPDCRRSRMVVEVIETKRDVEGPALHKTGRKWSWKPVLGDDDPDGPPCPKP